MPFRSTNCTRAGMVWLCHLLNELDEVKREASCQAADQSKRQDLSKRFNIRKKAVHLWSRPPSQTNPLYLMKRLVLSLLFAFCLSALLAQLNLTDSIFFQNMYRSYILHLPPAYDGNTYLPLVMGLHGGGPGDGLDLMEKTSFDELGDSEGFITLYPNGVFHDWADGRGVTDSEMAGIDDLGFLTALLDSLQQTYLIDPQRIYVWGPSNGGMMTQRLACEASQRFAAFASIISSLPIPLDASCSPTTPVSMLLMNGTEDNWVPYDGGPLGPLTDGGSTIGTDNTIHFWREHNGCSTDFQQTDFPDIEPDDNSTVTRFRYTDCNNGAEIVLYRVEGAGHTIPGMIFNTNPIFLLGYINYDITASTEIWNFFSNHLIAANRETLPLPKQLRAYPNPTSGMLYLSSDAKAQLPETVSLFNLKAQTFELPLLSQHAGEGAIDLSFLPKGTYYLRAKGFALLKLVLR